MDLLWGEYAIYMQRCANSNDNLRYLGALVRKAMITALIRSTLSFFSLIPS